MHVSYAVRIKTKLLFDHNSHSHPQNNDMELFIIHHGLSDSLITQKNINNPWRAVTSPRIPNGLRQIIRWDCHKQIDYPLNTWLGKHKPISLDMTWETTNL